MYGIFLHPALLFFSKQTEASCFYGPHRLLLSLGPGVYHIEYLAPSREASCILIVDKDIGVKFPGSIIRPLLFRVITVDGVEFNAVDTAVFHGFVKLCPCSDGPEDEQRTPLLQFPERNKGKELLFTNFRIVMLNDSAVKVDRNFNVGKISHNPSQK